MKAAVHLAKRGVRSGVYLLYHLLLEKCFRIFQKQKDLRLFEQSQPPLVKLIDFNGVQFAMAIATHGAIEDHILQHGNWSGDLLLLTDYFVQPNTAIVEVGANIGFESLYYARKYPNCVVYSYEPGAYAHHALSLSKAYNRLNNLELFKLGLGDATGVMSLESPTDASRNRGLGSLKRNIDHDETYERESVKIVTLDSHFSDLRRLSLIKIDTQGFEWNVLRGAVQTIKKHRPVILFEHEDQYHDDPHCVRGRIADLLEACGYDLYSAGAEILKRVDFVGSKQWHGDVLALPRT